VRRGKVERGLRAILFAGDPAEGAVERRHALVEATERHSYGEQARRLGAPGAVRAVGSANARNPLPIFLPCHRGLDAKQALLEHEMGVLAART
jgi:methylated-DNA-[protein]-cysteine S-methyltransferase